MLTNAKLFYQKSFQRVNCSLTLCASQLRMDFSTCAFILPIAVNNLMKSKISKHCGNLTDSQKPSATLFIPCVSISTQLKKC